MDLNAIMSNIYGENSSQNFDALGFSGGSLNRPEPHRANIRYLDETPTPPTQTTEIVSSYRANKIYSAFHDEISMTGGATAPDHIYPSAEYINNADLQDFIKEFYLHYLVANAHKNMILVVPSSSTLKKLITEFKAALKKEGISDCSPEASKFAAKSELEFKNYIFDVFGRNSPNNEGYPYQIDSNFPAKTSNEVYRRTNRASKQYFFKFGGANKIDIADNDKFTGGNTLKFLGKCDRAVFVLQGDIPASTGGKGKVVKASMAGGSKKSILRHEFMKCMKKYNDIDNAAYEFVARVAKASGPAQVAQFYSGDFVHAAFSLIAANEDGSFNASYDYDPNINMEDTHEEIIDNYKPVKNIVKLDKVAQVLPKILRDSCARTRSPVDANKAFISNLRKMYGAIKAPNYMLTADVATSLTKANVSVDGLRNAFNVMNEMDGVDDEGAITLSGGSLVASGGRTSFINSVYSAISASPFIGSIAHEYTPILISSGVKPSKAFEDINADLIHDMNEELETDDQPDSTVSDENSKKRKPKREVPIEEEGESGDESLDASEFNIKAFF